jgi:DNA-binding CsgD family transcriptional regulator
VTGLTIVAMVMPDSANERPVRRPPLTRRETEVLRHASLGRTNAQVAVEIGASVHAVKFHLASVFRKLGVSNRTEAALAYFRTVAPQDGQNGSES